jgi:hypothetical protein
MGSGTRSLLALTSGAVATGIIPAMASACPRTAKNRLVGFIAKCCSGIAERKVQVSETGSTLPLRFVVPVRGEGQYTESKMMAARV